MFSILEPADRRGNRIKRHELFTSTAEAADFLCIEGCRDVVAEIESAMARFGGRRIDPSTLRTPDGALWPTVFRYPTPRRAEVRQLVTLLTEVLTLASVPELDVGLALDFHQRGCGDGTLERTEVGELVYRAKYWTGNPTARSEAGKEVCDRLADVIRRHPLYSAAGLIVAVPSTRTGLSELLAEAVAQRVQKPWVTAVETTGSAWENKDGTDGVTPKQYRVTDKVFGTDVIVVDDLYRSGQSMRGVAAAVKARQAFSIYGLAATRTLKRT